MTAQLSRERLEEIRDYDTCVTLEESAEMARMLLAAEAREPVILYRERNPYNGITTGWQELTQQEFDFIKDNASENAEFKTLYAAPQPVAVPDEMTREEYKRRFMEEDDFDNTFRGGWNACRAAMLNAEPVSQPYTLPDDTKRMDWLVSKTVNVREPMVYGSHSLFWSQAITDENDEYHATKLREQIDAAMAEEQAAAPQEPNK
ncbi:hypothetical protein RN333_08505 [Enterobacter kobei]|uniref:hypothetical protein n=1 Tax=Enterobacter kobei TaxID=208224 RepID=UPI0028D5A4A8|nr:hypothetical protein [Enterobacter kobei]WNP33608.1 hypothetical protein RN333_16140 [Enterobacter kobei]WNP36224.1 hypothetical protein RN333_08505 [Enterobacter kobei]